MCEEISRELLPASCNLPAMQVRLHPWSQYCSASSGALQSTEFAWVPNGDTCGFCINALRQ